MSPIDRTTLNRKEALAAIALFAGISAGGWHAAPARGQDAAPVSDPVWEVLGSVNDIALAPGLNLDLARFTWMPGYAQELHTHNAADVIFVLAGEVAWRVERGEALVFRAPAAGTPTPPETLPDGAEALLGVGDAIAFDYGKQQVWHAGRTVGAAPVVMLFADFYDPEAPITVYAEELATPSP